MHRTEKHKINRHIIVPIWWHRGNTITLTTTPHNLSRHFYRIFFLYFLAGDTIIKILLRVFLFLAFPQLLTLKYCCLAPHNSPGKVNYFFTKFGKSCYRIVFLQSTSLRSPEHFKKVPKDLLTGNRSNRHKSKMAAKYQYAIIFLLSDEVFEWF